MGDRQTERPAGG